MIDLHRLRNEPDTIISLIQKKDPSFDGKALLALDEQVRSLSAAIDDLRCEKNELAKKGQHGLSLELREQAKNLGQALKAKEVEFQEKKEAFTHLHLRCPNIIQADVPEGNKEQNKVVKVFGEKPSFSFTPKNHCELGELNGWFDFEAAAQMTGSNFALYAGSAPMIVYKVMMYMLMHNIRRGFSPIIPPFIVNEKALQGAGNFPRFKEEVYHLEDEDLYLTPTSEVNLTSMYNNHIFGADQLPVRMTAWTSCFRKEAGGYGATERGLIRIHQFEKAEIYTICEPEKAALEQDHMLATAEGILQALGLHYQVCLLAAQDCSFSSAKTYDIEVWLPGQGAYKEISSVSNCTDFQARRSEIRYKESPSAKPRLVNTLNGSSLALPRLLVALMETYQQEDGSIILPELLNNLILP